MPTDKPEALALLQVQVEPSLIDALDRQATANDRTRSGELRAILKAALGYSAAPAHAGA